MKASLAIDCSMTMAWCFADEGTAATDEILDRLATEAAVVPAVWFLEVVNVLASAERHKRIAADDSDQFLGLLSRLEIQVDEARTDRAFNDVLPLCRSHGLTSYDAAYLELVLRRKLPLASLDDDLCRAAASLGIDVLGK